MGEETLTPENLEIVSREGFNELENILRRAPLNGVPGGIYHPYRESQITIIKVSPDELCPCALYVLKEGLSRAHELGQSFLTLGVDIANLTETDAKLTFNWRGRKGAVISFPIIEKSEDDGGKLIVIDGLHRIFDARRSGLKFITAVLIENAAAAIPAYPVSWDEVKIVESVPSMGEKRKFRFDSGGRLSKWVGGNYNRYMRGFDFPERAVLPLASSQKLADSEKYDVVELHKTSDSAFILDSDGILMVRRREDGKWALPSGGVDIVDVHPDSPWSLQSAPTLRRELYTETGLIALRWQRLVIGRTDRGRTIRCWRAEVADPKYVPMALSDYTENFNRNGGSEEVVKLGLFKPQEILKLNLYKEEYNIRAILSALLYRGLPIGELSQEDIAGVLQDADISEWEAQSGIEHAAPDYDYYRRDFSSLRSVT